MRVGLSYYKDAGGKYRWRMVSKNRRIVGAASQGFATVSGARENLALVQSFDLRKISHYVDASGNYRWRMMAKNGLVVGASTQGYGNTRDARKNIEAVQSFDPRPVEIEGIY